MNIDQLLGESKRPRPRRISTDEDSRDSYRSASTTSCEADSRLDPTNGCHVRTMNHVYQRQRKDQGHKGQGHRAESSPTPSENPMSESDLQDLRLRINSRERRRMHDLNSALEGLREVMPYAYGPSVRKLSKIATLLLAKNYIVTLQSSVEEMKRLVSDLCRGQSTPTRLRLSSVADDRFPPGSLPFHTPPPSVLIPPHTPSLDARDIRTKHLKDSLSFPLSSIHPHTRFPGEFIPVPESGRDPVKCGSNESRSIGCYGDGKETFIVSSPFCIPPPPSSRHSSPSLIRPSQYPSTHHNEKSVSRFNNVSNPLSNIDNVSGR